MQAQVGDELTVKGRHQGDEERHGEIIKVDGTDGQPPYVTRWAERRLRSLAPCLLVGHRHRG